MFLTFKVVSIAVMFIVGFMLQQGPTNIFLLVNSKTSKHAIVVLILAILL